MVAVASAGPFAPHSREITMPVSHHSVFTGRMPFLPPNQQCQSTEGNEFTTVILAKRGSQSSLLMLQICYCLYII